jgi:hypothetical protein
MNHQITINAGDILTIQLPVMDWSVSIDDPNEVLASPQSEESQTSNGQTCLVWQCPTRSTGNVHLQFTMRPKQKAGMMRSHLVMLQEYEVHVI